MFASSAYDSAIRILITHAANAGIMKAGPPSPNPLPNVTSVLLATTSPTPVAKVCQKPRVRFSSPPAIVFLLSRPYVPLIGPSPDPLVPPGTGRRPRPLRNWRPVPAFGLLCVAVPVVARRRHVQGRVLVEEAGRLHHEARVLHRHHRPVLKSSRVVRAERVP